MKTKAISAVVAALALGCIGTAALAADGLPDDPNSDANTIPAPDAAEPSDPSANDNPSARVPTDENEGYQMQPDSNGGASGEGSDQQQK